MSDNASFLILLAPLLAAILTAMPGGRLGRKVFPIGVLLHFTAFVAALAVLYALAARGHGPFRLDLLSLNGRLPVVFAIDRLAAVMMVVITGVGTLINRYSVRYMQAESGRARFHCLLSFAIVTLLCMVCSANLLMLFLFWQLLSWLLGLLPYNYEHAPTVKGAFRTYTILRLGDVVFLAGVVLAYRCYGTLDLEPLFSRAKAYDLWLTVGPGGGFQVRAVTAITLLIFVGGMSKSAQFPLHSWLPDFLFAPTPVCGFLHAGIINAGGFLLNRLAPLYGQSPAVLHIVFGVGLLTTFLGASMMLTQNDIKKTLGYSTIGQMGYMIMECGLGAFALAIFHLIAHGLFKANIFLNSGEVIHAARREPRLPPKDVAEEQKEFSLLAWLTGFATTLVLPLSILLAIHGILRIPLIDSQGTVIFLFFSWFTSSQAILTLYRLKAVASGKVAALMLVTLLLVVSTYLFAAEVFSHFLYPMQGDVAFYFQAAGLPDWLFDLLIAATSLFVIMGWVLIYARSHGRSFRARGKAAEWIGTVQIQLYLFFTNGLYLDALWRGLGRLWLRVSAGLERSRVFLPALIVLALALSVPAALRGGGFTLRSSLFSGALIPAALLLPLFPLHGAYVAALTRRRGGLPLALALALPLASSAGLLFIFPELPRGLLGVIRMLALFGGLYGSWKALTQVKVDHLLAYAGLALYSVLWWHLAVVGKVTPPAVVYTGSLALVSSGLLYALQLVQRRYGPRSGALTVDRISGLALVMPRFAVLLALLVMAAMGLPPFGVFAGLTAMLLHSGEVLATGHADLAVIACVFFTASYYLFKLMQRLLFGPPRSHILYTDLKGKEVTSLVAVVTLLVALGAVPLALWKPAATADSPRAAPERVSWHR